MRLDGVIKCLTCDIVYGTLYAVESTSNVYGNVTDPVVIPKYCRQCSNPLTRILP